MSKPDRAKHPANREQLLELVRGLPRTSGVYIMKSARGKELYVGKAKDLRARVRQYFDAARLDEKSAALMSSVHDIEIIETPSEVEALLLESRLIKDLGPKFNVRLKGTSYPLVEVTWGEVFPRVQVTRDTSARKSKFHGPFIEGRDLRVALASLRRIFRFCTCPSAVDPQPKHRVRPCLDYHVGLCLAPCAGKVEKDEYRAMIRRFEAFLCGRGRARMLKDLETRMQKAAANLHFEEAARLRDELKAIGSLDRKGDLSSPPPPSPPRVDPAKGLRDLAAKLDLPAPPKRIEGLDLANLSGREAAGSIVTFIDGKPAKGFYRRYRIKTAPGNDDYAQMAEVVTRRLKRLAENGEPGPDLLLLDGGAGHLAAAARAIENVPESARPRAFCSLAKREEIIHLPSGRSLKLPGTSAALKILQHVRDEAHRFAGQYHRVLRDRSSMKSSTGSRGRKKK